MAAAVGIAPERNYLDKKSDATTQPRREGCARLLVAVDTSELAPAMRTLQAHAFCGDVTRLAIGHLQHMFGAQAVALPGDTPAVVMEAGHCGQAVPVTIVMDTLSSRGSAAAIPSRAGGVCWEVSAALTWHSGPWVEEWFSQHLNQESLPLTDLSSTAKTTVSSRPEPS